MTAPRKGQRGWYHRFLPNGQIDPEPVGQFTVRRVEGNICICDYDHLPEGDRTSSFIWRFKDRLNQLHFWDGKLEEA